MFERPNTFQYVLQVLFAGALVAAIVFLLTLLPSPKSLHTVEAQASQPAGNVQTRASDDPNVIAYGGAEAMQEVGKAVDSTGFALNSSIQSAGSAVTNGSKSFAQAMGFGTAMIARGVASELKTVAQSVGSGVGFVGGAAADGVVAVLRAPANVIGFMSDTPVVRSVIRPSDEAEVPIIDPNSPELQKALAALPAEPVQATPHADVHAAGGPVWPISGEITTYFGVPHWPYQRTHSGIDIAGGRRAGATPVKPFRPGRVVETISSRTGLGNHVIIDHGNGVTSVYAHLYSIAVSVGQEVGLETVVGMEGSTGASTGTHLHFEIRVNGQATDPRQFIAGHP